MIELTTGVVFLMSSLYGSGQVDTHIRNMSIDPEQKEVVASEDMRSFKTQQDVEAYLQEEFSDTPILVDIARCESTFKQFAPDGRVIRGRIDRNDIGVMQINEKYHGESAAKLGLDIYSIEGNVAFAKHLYGKYGSKPWSASAKCWKGAIAKK